VPEKSPVYKIPAAPIKIAFQDCGARIGFGLWLDYRSHTVGWFPDAPVRNYFTPAAFREALRAARRVADAYVWVYSERLNWWTGEGVSPAYVEALRP